MLGEPHREPGEGDGREGEHHPRELAPAEPAEQPVVERPHARPEQHEYEHHDAKGHDAHPLGHQVAQDAVDATEGERVHHDLGLAGAAATPRVRDSPFGVDIEPLQVGAPLAPRAEDGLELGLAHLPQEGRGAAPAGRLDVRWLLGRPRDHGEPAEARVEGVDAVVLGLGVNGSETALDVEAERGALGERVEELRVTGLEAALRHHAHAAARPRPACQGVELRRL